MRRTHKQAGQGTVLIVDDDHDIRSMLGELLETEGFEVAQAENAADAINFLDEHEPPCAVLVDMVMPGIIGTSLLDYMEDEHKLEDVPVAVVSASPQMAPGGYPVFSKPVDPRALVDFVKAAGSKHRASHRRTAK